MSEPTEADFALVKMGDGASPEVFTQLCGLTDVQINKRANTSDRFVRDCTKPGEVPFRKTKVSGKMMDITGSGLSNVDEIVRREAAFGRLRNYRVELYAESDDESDDQGVLLGTYAGTYRMTSDDLNGPRDNPASSQVTLASHGAWTYTPAS